MNLQVIVLIIVINLGMSCLKLKQSDDVLSIERQNYYGDELQIHGYYFTEIQTFEGIIYNRYAFYVNGIVRYLGSSKSLEESNFVPGNIKRTWGVFHIENDTIKFERWYPSSGGPLPAYVRAGIILNDTTFHIKESYRMQNGKKTELRERNELYHFRQYSPKPDSTNPYIP